MEGATTDYDKNERIYLWDNLKVILMMQVVVTHSVNVYQLDGYYWIQYLWIFIMSYSMPLFMMISGYLYKTRTKKYAITHYLYPCILFSIINYIWGGYFGAYPNGISPKSGWAMWYIWGLFIYNVVTPIFMNLVSLKSLLIISFIISFIFGFKFIDNAFFDAQRIINFYPFFLIGILLKHNCEKKIIDNNHNKVKWAGLFGAVMLSYLIITYFIPGIPYQTGFMRSHGFSIHGFTIRWFTYGLTILLSICMIMIIPNKKIWMSQYGSRTMNVYLLHMLIVFPLCWGVFRPIMNVWYGYILYIFFVPAICSLLFSRRIDVFMQQILMR